VAGEDEGVAMDGEADFHRFICAQQFAKFLHEFVILHDTGVAFAT
jgi:hypothetical protein